VANYDKHLPKPRIENRKRKCHIKECGQVEEIQYVLEAIVQSDRKS